MSAASRAGETPDGRFFGQPAPSRPDAAGASATRPPPGRPSCVPDAQETGARPGAHGERKGRLRFDPRIPQPASGRFGPACMRSAWTALEQEVGRWRGAGREVTLWWRDDDAVEPSPALSRLLGLRPGGPFGLAVIPAAAKASLAGELTEGVDVLVHGFTHVDHAAPGARKSEYPAGRVVPDELRAGRERLEAIFEDRVLPVFVPPWNRMGKDAAGVLPAAGYEMLSGHRGRPVGPLPRLDTHVDLVDWRGGRQFAGTGPVLRTLAGALAARRRTGDPAPTGLLSHHLVHDAAAWRFLEDLLAWGEGARGVRWVRPRNALPGRRRRGCGGG